MRTIFLDYKIVPSVRPKWLLYFSSEARAFFDKTDDSDVDYKIHRLSELLNKQSFYQRKRKHSCEIIKREIADGRLRVYNSAGTKILLEISYI